MKNTAHVVYQCLIVSRKITVSMSVFLENQSICPVFIYFPIKFSKISSMIEKS